MQETTPEQSPVTRDLSFNMDGTIDPAQLEGLPQDFIDRVNSPEFIADAAKRITAHRMEQLALYRFRENAAKIRAEAARQAQLRRPKGVSGRQRKRLRRAATKSARVTIPSGENTDDQPAAPAHES